MNQHIKFLASPLQRVVADFAEKKLSLNKKKLYAKLLLLTPPHYREYIFSHISVYLQVRTHEKNKYLRIVNISEKK